MFRIIALFLLVTCIGCQATSARVPPASDPSNIQAFSLRAKQALARLQDVNSRTCWIEITPETTCEAGSWSSGRIVVSAGLMRALNDDELAAVLAHELGHMIADGKLQVRFSLDGCRRDLNCELVADDIGCKMLAASGIRPQTMAQMLRRVCAVERPGDCRDGLQKRIARLEAISTEPGRY